MIDPGRAGLLDLLDAHRSRFPEEAAMTTRARRFVAEIPDCFDRAPLRAHLSGSAWVLNPARDHVLLVLHRKLDLWLQPGGHADGDPDLLRVALRETWEEAGMPEDSVRPLSHAIFDVDVHAIPDTPAEPHHDHYDIRFLLEMDDRMTPPGNPDEAHAVAWVPLRAVRRFNTMRSVHRMLRKTDALRRGRRVAA
ncbi:NUDIX hydrolase [Roseospira navarrensis]|uniref:NUDIX domain-containing protein n=1 Tax=Roseospira navarrensis TaxID=140058 RepID=A0A7X1ZF01_9PROT|nr:NUDIX hydrolase [Roseospira navarrensis]MQX37363.1 NUDIX domain-containing protein [Roseospira navarrensis]